MSRYKAYPEYRDSGVEWLGQLPSHWGAKRLGQFFDERREKVSDEDYPALSVTMQGIVPQLETAAKTDAGDNRKLVLKDDFVINSRSDRKGSSGVSSYDGSVSLISIVMTPRGIHPPFAHHLLRSYPFQEEFYRYGKGIVADLWSTNVSEMRNILIPHAPITEQENISAFLDHETAKIDVLIEKQQRLIELLKEKRQAVISHAVTKGLNPNAPMKDSGVEWLGEVPAHWDVLAIKHIVSTPITDGPHETPEFFDTGIPFVSAEAVSSGRIDFGKIRAHISDADNQRFSKKYSPKKFDIYMVKSGATTGVTAIVETDDVFNIWSPLAAIRCNELNHPYFVLNFMRSRNFADAIAISWSFGTQQNIGMKVIENLPITRPPLSEAIEIANSLQDKSVKFDKIILQAQAQIELMQERRTALISAAVTGKIDVRDWQAAA
jgi:type I restriction enzyme, S subunit